MWPGASVFGRLGPGPARAGVLHRAGHLAAGWNDSTAVVSAANLTAFGILWVAKYLLLDSLLFALPGDDSELATS